MITTETKGRPIIDRLLNRDNVRAPIIGVEAKVRKQKTVLQGCGCMGAAMTLNEPRFSVLSWLRGDYYK